MTIINNLNIKMSAKKAKSEIKESYSEKYTTHWSKKIFFGAFTLSNIVISIYMQRDFSDLENTRVDFIRQLNVTPNLHDGFLFFTRVPKSGSSSFATILNELSKVNNFTMYTYKMTNGNDVELESLSSE